MKYHFDKDLDDPLRAAEHERIIRNKPFLKKLYLEWYRELSQQIQLLPEGKIIELGSGGGFIKDIFPQVITSDVMKLSSCDMCFPAENIPMENNTVAAYFMLNVFHHIPDPEKFLREADRTLKKGGRIIMVEPANSFFSRIIYKNFHHEPFNEKGEWTIESTGPMSSSNQALPYIYFIRDRELFRKKFPSMKIISVRLHTPFRYLLSGGVSRKSLVPAGSFGLFSIAEKIISPLSAFTAMFQTIVVEKIN